jgi:hypothetical protein
MTCREHLGLCRYCARPVCTRDIEPHEGQCATCRRLVPVHEVPSDILAAGAIANGGPPLQSRGWRIGRDSAYFVVDVDLGRSRHLVFTVPTGAAEPYTVMTYHLLGSKRVR